MDETMLAPGIERMRAILAAAVSGDNGDPPGHVATAVSPALAYLSAALQLTPFESDLLQLCTAVELDGEVARLVAAWHEAQGQPGREQPTFGLALAVLADGHWSALSPARPLRRWRLLEVGGGQRLLDWPLRLDERVLHYLLGVSYLDEQLAGYVEPLSQMDMLLDSLTPAQQALAGEIAALWTVHAADEERLPAVQLISEDRYAILAVAAAACANVGLSLYRLPSEVLPAAPAELELLQRLWEREALFSDCALVLSGDWLETTDLARQSLVQRFVDNLRSPVLLIGRKRRRRQRRPLLTYEVPQADTTAQVALWRSALGPEAGRLDGRLDDLAAQFHLSPPAMWAAVAQAAGTQNPDNAANGRTADDKLPAIDDQALWLACRAQARPQLDDLTQRLQPVATWDDLILPERELTVLRDIALQVRQRTTVYERWAFARKSSRGLGISALFHGPSGTGKTMAAEVLANELELDLYRIDLSQVVSKYIGETEKNLGRVFNAAEAGAVILLFDEADALFGKRSEVKDSHDRYANIEIGYLLQRMEAYRGLAILTTNMKDALDHAFVRRIRFMVVFPFPDAGQRAAIWSRIFPGATPTVGLDMARLAQLNITGGSIQNIALNAAFYAADADRPVAMNHIVRAAEREYAKLERSLTGGELRGWDGYGNER